MKFYYEKEDYRASKEFVEGLKAMRALVRARNRALRSIDASIDNPDRRSRTTRKKKSPPSDQGPRAGIVGGGESDRETDDSKSGQ